MRTRDHEGDRVRDVLGRKRLDLAEVGREDVLEDLGPVVRRELSRDRARLEQADPHVALGDLLAERLGEGAEARLGEAVDGIHRVG